MTPKLRFSIPETSFLRHRLLFSLVYRRPSPQAADALLGDAILTTGWIISKLMLASLVALKISITKKWVRRLFPAVFPVLGPFLGGFSGFGAVFAGFGQFLSTPSRVLSTSSRALSTPSRVV